MLNGAGKTDILIRDDDHNVFVGECKIWKGPKSVTKALGQLVGYLGPRDTKAALLLLIRDADVATVTAKAVGMITEHRETGSRRVYYETTSSPLWSIISAGARIVGPPS